MEKSNKNKVLEYCIKNDIKPVYKTEKLMGCKDHEPIWITELTVDDKIFKGKGKGKKEAESYASELYIKDIEAKIINTEKKQKLDCVELLDVTKYDTITLVDGENVNLRYIKNELVLVFVSEGTTRKVFDYQKYDNYYVFISPKGPDSADIMLTLNLGKLSILYPDKKYNIITKDHFANYFEILLKNCHVKTDL